VATVDGVMQAVNEPNSFFETGMGQFAISASGSLVYASGGIFPLLLYTLVSVDRKGAQTELNAPKGGYFGLRISPDGQRLAVSKFSGTSRASDIWVLDTSRGTSTRLTSQGTDFWPLWSPDGKRILYMGGTGGLQILSVLADGSGAIEPVTTGKAEPASWSADGKWLAYLEYRDGLYQIWTRPMSGGGEPKQVSARPGFHYMDAEFSPDGRWMAYSSNESGASEVYVQAFPGPGDKYPISTGGGFNPVWGRNGRELFYLTPAGRGKLRMVAVDIQPGATFQAGPPRVLIEGLWPWLKTAPLRSYDITPDCQHFIMARPEEIPDQRVTKLNVVLKWFDELKKRAPRSGQ